MESCTVLSRAEACEVSVFLGVLGGVQKSGWGGEGGGEGGAGGGVRMQRGLWTGDRVKMGMGERGGVRVREGRLGWVGGVVSGESAWRFGALGVRGASGCEFTDADE